MTSLLSRYGSDSIIRLFQCCCLFTDLICLSFVSELKIDFFLYKWKETQQPVRDRRSAPRSETIPDTETKDEISAADLLRNMSSKCFWVFLKNVFFFLCDIIEIIKVTIHNVGILWNSQHVCVKHFISDV